MPHASAKDGTRLYYEESGRGTPLIFIHEFAGDHRSWEPQMRFFARYFRCITYAARGFPRSERRGVERRQRVGEVGVEGARTLGVRSGVLARHAERGQRLGGGLERPRGASRPPTFPRTASATRRRTRATTSSRCSST